jgi:hypothetical protein
MSHRNKAQQNFSRGLQTVTDTIGNKKVQGSGPVQSVAQHHRLWVAAHNKWHTCYRQGNWQ